MIFLSDTYTDRQILSLRTGTPIGHAGAPIINPGNLKIEGWHAQATEESGDMVLPVLEIRDIIAKGFVVNDHDAITPAEDLVRMKDLIESRYELIGKPVETENGRKIGKVKDYAVENKSLFIKKLYVVPGLFKSLTSFSKTQIIIDRTQIVDVTKDKIVVRESTERVTEGAQAAVRA